MHVDKKQIARFQKEILDWYQVNKRDLPWRHTRDPYRVLVSEMMLQQTQVGRVIPKYTAWLKTFPTIEDLARAKKEDVLRLWSGLGYNRRALFLQKTAEIITNNQLPITNTSSYWPQTTEELQKLPGIGPYTARAIACFAFGQEVAVVDANVRKVILTRILGSNNQELRIKADSKQQIDHNSLFIIHNSTIQSDKVSDKEIASIAEEILPKGRAYDWNQALMDYSALELQQYKVPTYKQKTFKKSNRFYRGKLLRFLLQKKSLEINQVGYLLRDDFSEQDETWKDELLKNLERDGLVQIHDDEVSI